MTPRSSFVANRLPNNVLVHPSGPAGNLIHFRRRRPSLLFRVRQQLAKMTAAGAIVAGSCLFTPATLHAQLPDGSDVVAGAAVVSTAGGVLDVNASTARTIINWDQFGVAAGQTANFNLPNADASILNRVTGIDLPSVIAGTLNSNGNVFLVNPAGIMVSGSGVVNTNSFTASTFDISNENFLAGGVLTFTNNGSTASVQNNGTINTGSNGAHLIANAVINNGVISSTGGTITLSGGGVVTLDNGAIYIQSTMDTLAGGISPTAGLIQNTGVIRAIGAVELGGRVFLANPNGTILHDGTITAQRVLADGNTTGGKVQLEANEVTLSESSIIAAAGQVGGGEVLVGGDWQGSGNMTQATSVTMASGATIDASATQAGNGGKIVLWSDISNAESVTRAFGTLIARAGELLGNGGQIETSGATIDTNGITVDAGAASGTGGHWLIDPFNYVIDAVAANNIVGALNTGTSVTVTTTANNAAYGSSGNIDDLGDITVAHDIVTGAMTGDATLSLNAQRHVVLNDGIVIDGTQNGNTNGLNVKFWADYDNNGDGMNVVGGSIKTNGGNLEFGNGNYVSIGGVSTQVGGDVFFNSSGAQVFETNGGDINLRGETIISNSRGVSLDSSGGDIGLAGSVNSGNSYQFIDGPDGQANSWAWSRTQARNGTAGGAAEGDSYLVTITSRLENLIAGYASGYRGSWIGALRDVSTPLNWEWVDGPEAGQHFFTETSAGGGTPVSGHYSNFGAGEPNGGPSALGETQGQFFGTAGQWNDLGSATTFAPTQASQYSVLGYVRETNEAPSPMVIDAGSGDLTVGGGIGGLKALASLNVTAATTTINGNALVTTGIQSYSGLLDVNSPSNLVVKSSGLTVGGNAELLARGELDLWSGIDTSVATGGDIDILAFDNIKVHTAAEFRTNDGDVEFASNGNNSGHGAFDASENVTIDTQGGNITIGGPFYASYATGGETADSLSHGIRFQKDVTLQSGGGNISLRGRSGTSSTAGKAAFGIGLGGISNHVEIHSGNGSILIQGIGRNTTNGAFSEGTVFNGWRDGQVVTGSTNITSSSAARAIKIIGDARAATPDANGFARGLVFWSEDNNLVSTGTGPIELDGYRGANRTWAIQMEGGNILAPSGRIEIIGGSNNAGESGYLALNNVNIGGLAGSAVETSASDVEIQSDGLESNRDFYIDTTGKLRIHPFGNTFAGVGGQFDFDGDISTGDFLGADGDSGAINIRNYSSLGGLHLGDYDLTTGFRIYVPIDVLGSVAIQAGFITLDHDVITSRSPERAGISLYSSGQVTIPDGVDVRSNDGSIFVTGTDVSFGGEISTGGHVSLGASSSITDAENGAVLAESLMLDGETAILDNLTHSVNKFSAFSNVVEFINDKALLVTQLSEGPAVFAQESAQISTQEGDLTIDSEVVGFGPAPVTLSFNAGMNSDAGDIEGGDVILLDSEDVFLMEGSSIHFLTGSDADTDLDGLQEATATNKRYNSDETTVFSPALDSGLTVIYRGPDPNSNVGSVAPLVRDTNTRYENEDPSQKGILNTVQRIGVDWFNRLANWTSGSAETPAVEPSEVQTVNGKTFINRKAERVSVGEAEAPLQ